MEYIYNVYQMIKEVPELSSTRGSFPSLSPLSPYLLSLHMQPFKVIEKKNIHEKKNVDRSGLIVPSNNKETNNAF